MLITKCLTLSVRSATTFLTHITHKGGPSDDYHDWHWTNRELSPNWCVELENTFRVFSRSSSGDSKPWSKGNHSCKRITICDSIVITFVSINLMSFVFFPFSACDALFEALQYLWIERLTTNIGCEHEILLHLWTLNLKALHPSIHPFTHNFVVQIKIMIHSEMSLRKSFFLLRHLSHVCLLYLLYFSISWRFQFFRFCRSNSFHFRVNFYLRMFFLVFDDFTFSQTDNSEDSLIITLLNPFK